MSSTPSECKGRLDALVERGFVVLTDGACHACTLKPSKGSGYPQVQFKGVKVLASHLALRASERELPSEGEDVSHYACSNPICVNPDHVIVEPKRLNQMRKGCPGTLILSAVAPDGTALAGSLCLCSCVTRWAEVAGVSVEAALALYPSCCPDGKVVTVTMLPV